MSLLSPRESIRQLQNTLGVSVYRWKFLALNDWHHKLITVFPLTNVVISDISQRLQTKYSSADKVFSVSQFQAINKDERWFLLLQQMSECEQLTHAIWEYVQKKLKQSKDNYLRYELRITCYEAGLKELDRIKQNVLTTTKKKESLIRSLVRSKRWSLPQERKPMILCRYKSEESLQQSNTIGNSRFNLTMISEVKPLSPSVRTVQTASPISEHYDTESDYSDDRGTPSTWSVISDFKLNWPPQRTPYESTNPQMNRLLLSPTVHGIPPGYKDDHTQDANTVPYAWSHTDKQMKETSNKSTYSDCCSFKRHNNRVQSVINLKE